MNAECGSQSHGVRRLHAVVGTLLAVAGCGRDAAESVSQPKRAPATPVAPATPPPESPVERPAAAGGKDDRAAELPLQTMLFDCDPAGRHVVPGATFVGGAACARCHEQECAAQATHHMARTGAWIDAASAATLFSDARLEREVRMPAGAEACVCRYEREGDGVRLVASVGALPLVLGRVDAVFGSQARGMTPIRFERGGRVRELPLSYSTALECWQLTPEQKAERMPTGVVHSVEKSGRCVSCHATVVGWRGERIDREATVLGIDCERCHGAGSAHVAAADARAEELAIYNPGRLPRREQVAFCGQCHRTPADHLSPYMIVTDHKEVARHAGLAMMMSDCYRRSADGISCLECHDPHLNVETSHDRSNACCQRCHADPVADHRPGTAVDASSDCVGCHMPKVDDVVFGLPFTNHWIRLPAESHRLEGDALRECIDSLEPLYRARLEAATTGPEARREARLNLAECLLHQDRGGDALAIYRTLVPGRELVPLAFALAKALVEAARPAAAADLIRAARRERPADPTLERIAAELARLPAPDLSPQPLQFTIEEQDP